MNFEVSIPMEFYEPLNVPEKILMGPGPSNYPSRVQKAMSNPVLGQLHPETFKIMDDIKKGLKYLFQTHNPLTLCVSGPGHAGMETAFCNLIEEGDVVLICITGIWGERAADMARRQGADVRLLHGTAGSIITMFDAKEYIEIHKPSIFFIAHGESSTGVLQPLEGLGSLCQANNCLLVVDAVITLGAVRFYTDAWKIDVAYSGSQKVLNAPPGITPITFSTRAIQKIQSRNSPVKVYTFDIQLLGEYWNCFANRARIYHHTISSTLLYGLREAIAVFIENGGLETSFKRHEMCSKLLQDGLKSNGLEMFIENPRYRTPTVNSVNVPKDVDWQKVTKYAMSQYSVEIAGGLGPTAGEIFRIGLMGGNATEELVKLVLKVLQDSINYARTDNMQSKI
ncbi:unnamed protein product [Diamesa serratosioi]